MDVDFVGTGCGVLSSKIIRKRKAVFGSDKKREIVDGQSGTMITSLRYLYLLYSSFGNFSVNTIMISKPFLAYFLLSSDALLIPILFRSRTDRLS